MDDEEMYLKYVNNFPDEPTMEKLIKAVDEKDYAAVDIMEELRDGNTDRRADSERGR